MKLKLHLSGSAEPFVSYLKNYLKIRESLLLEIDTTSRAFVAKTFTEDKSAIRFASITFDDANISFVSDDGEAERGDARIKAGILIQLKKFIQIVERFGSDVDAEGKADFDIEVSYEPFALKEGGTDFVSTQIQFSSKILKMKIDGFRPTEIAYLPDDVFINNIFNVSDAVRVELTAAKIADIIKISDIIKMDARRDALSFYVEGKTLYVKDVNISVKSSDNQKSDFVYTIGEVDHEPDYPISLIVNREKFVKMVDKSEETFTVILGKYTVNGSGAVDRILLDSTSNPTKIVIGAMKEN